MITFENHDPNDPMQHAVWCAFFPEPRSAKRIEGKRGSIVPLPVGDITGPLFSQMLWDLGYRRNPELQTKFPIPAVPGAPMDWANPPVLVSRAEYDKYWATHARPTDAQLAQEAAASTTLRGMLAAIAPEKLAHIDSLTPEQREAAQPGAEAALVPQLQRLQGLRQEMANRKGTRNASKG